jgi:hypothetical protein
MDTKRQRMASYLILINPDYEKSQLGKFRKMEVSFEFCQEHLEHSFFYKVPLEPRILRFEQDKKDYPEDWLKFECDFELYNEAYDGRVKIDKEYYKSPSMKGNEYTIVLGGDYIRREFRLSSIDEGGDMDYVWKTHCVVIEEDKIQKKVKHKKRTPKKKP